jgi:hypothetical protein
MFLKDFELTPGKIILREFHNLLKKPVAFLIIQIFGRESFRRPGKAKENIPGKRRIVL